MAYTRYAQNKMIDAAHGKTVTWPSTLYAALSTTTPTVTGTNFTEPVGNGYVRVAVPNTAWAAASGGSAANTAAIQFATPTGSQGTVTYLGFYDASTAGNLMSYDDLPAAKALDATTTMTFPVGQASDAFA